MIIAIKAEVARKSSDGFLQPRAFFALVSTGLATVPTIGKPYGVMLPSARSRLG